MSVSKIQNSGFYSAPSAHRAEKTDRPAEGTYDQINIGSAHPEAASHGGKTDSVRISHFSGLETTPAVNFAEIKSNILRELRGEPDDQRMQELRDQIEGGRYEINAAEIARAML